MKIIEQCVISKYTDTDHCEDGIFSNDDFIVLIDGATSKKLLSGQKPRSGELAKDEIITAMGGVSRSIVKKELFEYLNAKLLERMKEQSIRYEDKLDWFRASVIVFSKYHSKIWSYGDCQLMVNAVLLSKTKEIDLVLAGIRSQINQLYDTNPTVKDLGREFIGPLLIKQLDYENVDCKYGYPVLNGYSQELLSIDEFTIQKGDEIVFASDGYPILRNTLRKCEQELERLIIDDPGFCFESIQTKGLYDGCVSFDDRSFIRFIV